MLLPPKSRANLNRWQLSGLAGTEHGNPASAFRLPDPHLAGLLPPPKPWGEEPRNRKETLEAGGARGLGWGMELRALWLLCWCGCWCYGGGHGAGPGATFTRAGPRSREQQAAAFRVPSAPPPCLFLSHLSCPESGLGPRGLRAWRFLGIPSPAEFLSWGYTPPTSPCVPNVSGSRPVSCLY